jgi:ABC-2 type transport system permease protein
MNAVLAIALKDLRLLMRDRANAFFTFVFPILLAVFFGMIFRGASNAGAGRLTIALVDEDATQASSLLVADIKADTALNVLLTAPGEGDRAPLTRETGLSLVRRGKADACIIVPKGFGDAAGGVLAGGQMKLEGLVPPGRSAEAGLLTGKLNELAFKQLTRGFGDPAQVKKQLDAARKSLASSDVSLVQRAAFEALMSSVQNLTEANQRQASEASARGETPPTGPGDWKPVDVSIGEVKPERNLPSNSFQISFPQGVVWGLMGCVTAFGLSLANERTRGTLMRLTTAPISRRQIIIGKALSCFIACVLVQGLLLFVALVFFGVRVGSWAMMGMAVIASALGFVGVMMAMAGLSRSEGGGSGMGRAVILVLAMIGGGTIPLFLLPPFMQKVSSVSPFTWATLAFEGALWRGFSAADMLMPAGVLLAFCVSGFAIGLWAMRWTTRA